MEGRKRWKVCKGEWSGVQGVEGCGRVWKGVEGCGRDTIVNRWSIRG